MQQEEVQAAAHPAFAYTQVSRASTGRRILLRLRMYKIDKGA